MGFLLGLIIWVLGLFSLALVVYCILSFVAPESSIFIKARSFVEPILVPFRSLINKHLPTVANFKIDLSPIAAAIAIEALSLVLKLIRNIFR